MSTRRALKVGNNYKNKSSIFLLPMFGIKLYHISNKINYLIETCFILGDVPRVVLIFDNIDYEPLKEDIYKLVNMTEFVDSEYGDNNKEILIYLKLPKEFFNDFNLFIKGKYSEFSDSYKEILIKSYTDKSGEGYSKNSGLPNVSVYDAINPNDKLRNLMNITLGTKERIIEVLDAPKLEEEEFKKI